MTDDYILQVHDVRGRFLAGSLFLCVSCMNTEESKLHGNFTLLAGKSNDLFRFLGWFTKVKTPLKGTSASLLNLPSNNTIHLHRNRHKFHATLDQPKSVFLVTYRRKCL